MIDEEARLYKIKVDNDEVWVVEYVNSITDKWHSKVFEGPAAPEKAISYAYKTFTEVILEDFN